MASVSRNYDQDTIVYVLQLTLADNSDGRGRGSSPWFRLIEVIGEEVVGGRVRLTALVENSHELLKLGRDIWNAVVAPSSPLGPQGEHHHSWYARRLQCDGQRLPVVEFIWERLCGAPHRTKRRGLCGTDRASDACFSTAWRLGYYERPRTAPWPKWPQNSGCQGPPSAGIWGTVEITAHRRLAARLRSVRMEPIEGQGAVRLPWLRGDDARTTATRS